MTKKACAATLLAPAMAAVSMLMPAEANASCFAANGKTSSDGKCVAGPGSVAIVLGQVSVAKANSSNSFALTVGYGSLTELNGGNNNLGVTIGNNNVNTTNQSRGGNKLFVVGYNSIIDDTVGGGNTFVVRGENSNITSDSKTGSVVRVIGNGSKATINTNGRGTFRGNGVSGVVG